MMPRIIMEKECRCFQESDFENNIEFESIDEALDVSNAMAASMRDEFCCKHDFKAVYDGENMIIKVEMNG